MRESMGGDFFQGGGGGSLNIIIMHYVRGEELKLIFA